MFRQLEEILVSIFRVFSGEFKFAIPFSWEAPLCSEYKAADSFSQRCHTPFYHLMAADSDLFSGDTFESVPFFQFLHEFGATDDTDRFAFPARPSYLSLNAANNKEASSNSSAAAHAISWATPDRETSAAESTDGTPRLASQPRSNSSRYKTELCRPFMETGTCRYGEKCQFAHGTVEQRAIERHPKYKTEACRTFYKDGFCPYGSRCHFVHEPAESQTSSVHGSQSDGSDGGSNPSTPNIPRPPPHGGQLNASSSGTNSPMMRSRPSNVALARTSPPRSRQGRTPASPPLPGRFPSHGSRFCNVNDPPSAHAAGAGPASTGTPNGAPSRRPPGPPSESVCHQHGVAHCNCSPRTLAQPVTMGTYEQSGSYTTASASSGRSRPPAGPRSFSGRPPPGNPTAQQQTRKRQAGDERPPYHRSASLPAYSLFNPQHPPALHMKSPDLSLQSLQGAIDEVVSGTPQLELFPVGMTRGPFSNWDAPAASGGSESPPQMPCLAPQLPSPIGSHRSNDNEYDW